MFCNGLCEICNNPCGGGIFYEESIIESKTSEEEIKFKVPKLGTQEFPINQEDEQIEDVVIETGLSVITDEDYEVKKNVFGKLVGKRKK